MSSNIFSLLYGRNRPFVMSPKTLLSNQQLSKVSTHAPSQVLVPPSETFLSLFPFTQVEGPAMRQF